MHMQHLPREDTSCQPGETFYACSTGDFRGCCSIDPCERGFCAFDAMTDSGDKPSKTVPTSTSSIRSRGDMTLALTSDESNGTEMPTDTSSKSAKDHDEPTSTKNDKPSKTMTDSGITHTIPNNNPVTITKHTIIVTDKTPTPKPSSVLTPSGALWTTTHNLPGTTHTHTVVAGDSAADAASSSPSTGLIAGVSIGGAIALGICTFLLIRFFRRRRLAAASEGRFSIDGIRDNDHGEKNYLQVVSPHTTGTQGSDPFAPFGGPQLSSLLTPLHTDSYSRPNRPTTRSFAAPSRYL